MKRICVVIVNYCTPSLCLDCLDSLNGQLDPITDCVVIVDNCSEGGDLDAIYKGIDDRGLEKNVHVIASPVNRGFSAGNNLGIKAQDSEFFLLANADTLFRKGSVASLLQAASEYPEAGMISPRLEWPDGDPQISCFRFHSPLSELINSAGTGVITKKLYHYNVPLDLSEETTWPDWTSFACVFIRKEVFATIGGLDEGYFMYYEDVDFCRRARKAGFSLLNYPSSRVVHLRGQSSGLKEKQNKLSRLPSYYYRSRARYFVKFYGRTGFWLTNLSWYAGWCVCLAREFLLGRKKTLPKYQSIDIWKQ